MAKSKKYTVIGIVVETDPRLIDHLNTYRTNFGSRSFIPKIAYNTMKKQLRDHEIKVSEFDFYLKLINQIQKSDFDNPEEYHKLIIFEC